MRRRRRKSKASSGWWQLVQRPLQQRRRQVHVLVMPQVVDGLDAGKEAWLGVERRVKSGVKFLRSGDDHDTGFSLPRLPLNSVSLACRQPLKQQHLRVVVVVVVWFVE